MAAPRFVPTGPTSSKYYESPPQRSAPSTPRLAEVTTTQPSGPGFGSQGPDQGFIYKLVGHFDERLTLFEGEHRRDVDAGAIAIALKRASVFGRAPIVHDLTVGYTLWGYLDTSPAESLVRLRRSLFEETANPHHRTELREIADAVSEDVLRATPAAVTAQYERDWQAQLDLPEH